MANNPYVNRVETADGNTIMDISDTTAGAGDVLSGEVFYTKSGARTVGTLDVSGYVTGPASAVDGHVAVFDGTTGKTIKDSGYTIGKSVPGDAVFTDTTYTAGAGMSLSSGAFSVTGMDTSSGSTSKCLTEKGTWASFTNNAGTITGITMNGASKGTSGVVDLGTVITSHQDISGKVDKSGDTMTGDLTVQKASQNTGVAVKDTTTGLQDTLHIPSNPQNHGIYSNGYVDSNNTFHSDSKWMIYRDANNKIIVNGKATENVLTSDVQMKSGNNNWWEASADKLPHYYKYEGQNTTTYKLPVGTCIVMVIKESAARGVAFAIKWAVNNSTSQMWIARLHDDNASSTFSAWEEITDRVKRSGDTMSGDLVVQKASGDIVVRTANSTSSLYAALEVGSSGYNHGVYSNGYVDSNSAFHADAKWMIYRSSDNIVRVNGRATDNVLKSGDTMSGSLTVSKSGDASVAATNSAKGQKVSLLASDYGDNGVYSNGYVDSNKTFHSDAKWIIYRDSTNVVKVNGRATDNVLKTGDTMTGNLIIQKASGATHFVTKRTDTGLCTYLYTSDNNHGVYSNGYVDSNNTFHSDAKWLIYRNAGNVVYVNGRASDNVLKSGDTMTGDLTGTNFISTNYNLETIGSKVNTVKRTFHYSSVNKQSYFTLEEGHHAFVGIASGFVSFLRVGSTLYNTTLPSGFTASLSGSTVTVTRNSDTTFIMDGIVI